MEVKAAVATTAPAASSADIPDENAERVVAGARHLSPNLGNRMAATKLLGKSIFVRELLPQDLKLEIKELKFSSQD